MSSIKGVLFDLDGTLLDTLDDLLFAFNRLRAEYALPATDKSNFLPYISQGARAMVKSGFNIDETSQEFHQLKERFLGFYEQHIAQFTHFFPNMEQVLQTLEAAMIPWGIVTNKHTKQTHQLLNSLQIADRPNIIVCGDTLTKAKPHPDPILHAVTQMNIEPRECLYVGDALTDALASEAAGTRTIIALYGYIREDEQPHEWPAEGFIQDPIDLMAWLQR